MKFCSRYKLSNCVMHLQLLTLTIASFLLALHPSITYPVNQNAANKLTTKLDNHIKLRTYILYIDGSIKPSTFFSAILLCWFCFLKGITKKNLSLRESMDQNPSPFVIISHITGPVILATIIPVDGSKQAPCGVNPG